MPSSYIMSPDISSPTASGDVVGVLLKHRGPALECRRFLVGVCGFFFLVWFSFLVSPGAKYIIEERKFSRVVGRLVDVISIVSGSRNVQIRWVFDQ